MQSLPSDMRSDVFKIVLKNGGDEAFKQVLGYFDTATDNAEKKHVLSSIGVTPDVGKKLEVLEWTTSGAVKLQDFFYAIGSVHSSGKEGRELAWKFFKDNLGKFKGMLGKASASLMDAVIALSCREFSSFEKADEIETFFDGADLPQNKRKVEQVIESIRANAAFLGLLEKSELTEKKFWDGL